LSIATPWYSPQIRCMPPVPDVVQANYDQTSPNESPVVGTTALWNDGG